MSSIFALLIFGEALLGLKRVTRRSLIALESSDLALILKEAPSVFIGSTSRKKFAKSTTRN